MGLGFPPSLSPSSVSAFKSCPLAFKFSYIDRLPEPPSPAATKGTLVHRALELLMCRPEADRTVDAALVNLETARVEMADDPDLAGLELTDEQRAQFDADAEELVRKYFLLEDIDRLEIDDDGEFVVTDYKTGSVPSEFAENARLSGVHIYAALCEQMLGKRPARVQLYYLSKPEAIIATPTEQSVAGVGRRADALWTAILRACERDDFRPHTGPLCDYCTFKPYCPAFGGDPVQAAELRGPGTMIEPSLPLVAS
jgi:putative RecB family exonuclease